MEPSWPSAAQQAPAKRQFQADRSQIERSQTERRRVLHSELTGAVLRPAKAAGLSPESLEQELPAQCRAESDQAPASAGAAQRLARQPALQRWEQLQSQMEQDQVPVLADEASGTAKQ